MKMMGRIIGGVIGSAIGRKKGNNPVAGAVIGAGTLFVARRMFPQRYAALAATAAAAYLTKKWADRAELRRAEEAALAAGRGAAAGLQRGGAETAAPQPSPDGRDLGDALPPTISAAPQKQRPATR